MGLGLSIYLKKYKLLQNKLGIYFENEVGGTRNSQKTKTNIVTNYSGTGWGMHYNFNPGVFYKFSDRLFSEVNLGGVYASYNKPAPDQSSFGAGISFLQSFNLGINYRINKK